MKRLVILATTFLTSIVVNAQSTPSGVFSVPECKVLLYPDGEPTTDKLVNAYATIGKTGVTLTFGGFNAFVFVWKGEPVLHDGRTYRTAIDLVSGTETQIMIEEAAQPYKYALVFSTKTERTFVFPLAKKEKPESLTGDLPIIEETE